MMFCYTVGVIFSLQPGCVSTTEVDIKKACRMNRHSKMSRVSVSFTFFVLSVVLENGEEESE